MRKKGSFFICLLVAIAIMGMQYHGVVGEFQYPMLPEKILSYGYYSDYLDSDLNVITTMPDKTWGPGNCAGIWRANDELCYWQELDYPSPVISDQSSRGWMGYGRKPRIISNFVNGDFVPQYLLGSWTGLDLTHNILFATKFTSDEYEYPENSTTIYNLTNFSKVGELKNYRLDNLRILSSKYGYLDEGLLKKTLISLSDGKKILDMEETFGGLFRVWKNLVFGDKAVFNIDTGEITKPFGKEFDGGIPYVSGNTVVYISEHDIDPSEDYDRYKVNINRFRLPDFKFIDKTTYETDFDIGGCFGAGGKYCTGNNWSKKAPKGWHILDTMTGEIIYQIPKEAFFNVFNANENNQVWLTDDNCISIYDLEKKVVLKKAAFGSSIYAQDGKLYLIENELTEDGAACKVYETNSSFEKGIFLATIGAWDTIAHIYDNKVAYYSGGDWLKTKVSTNVKNEKGEFITHEYSELNNLHENGRIYTYNHKNRTIETRNVFSEKPERSIMLKKDTSYCELFYAKYPWIVANRGYENWSHSKSYIYNFDKPDLVIELPVSRDARTIKIIGNRAYFILGDIDENYKTGIIDLSNGNYKTLNIFLLQADENKIVGLEKTGLIQHKIKVFNTKTLELQESFENPNDFIDLHEKFDKWFSSSFALDSEFKPIQEIIGLPIDDGGVFSTYSDEMGIADFSPPISSIKYSSCPSYKLELLGKIYKEDGNQMVTLSFTNNSISNDTPLDIKFQVIPWGDDGFPLPYTKLSDNWVNLSNIQKGEKQYVILDISDAMSPNPNLPDAAKAGKRFGVIIIANGLMDTLGMENDLQKSLNARFEGQPLSYGKHRAVAVRSFAIR